MLSEVCWDGPMPAVKQAVDALFPLLGVEKPASTSTLTDAERAEKAARVEAKARKAADELESYQSLVKETGR